MSLKYKVVQLVNPAKREEPKKFYAQLAESGRVDLDELPIVFQKPRPRLAILMCMRCC